MIITSSMPPARRLRAPARRSGTVRIASLDAEWLKNYKVKNGQRPFCFSVVWLDLPTTGDSDLTDAAFEWTSVYVEEPGEMGEMVRHAAATLAYAADSADIITGHQLCSDLSVLQANAPDDALPGFEQARDRWRQRRAPAPGTARYVDTRYDAGHVLTGASRRLVDVAGELGLDVTQPELQKVTMPAWHRRWIEDRDTEGRERVSVLNLRHSLSTAYVAARAEELGHWPADGLNVNRSLAEGAKGAWAWLEHPTFTALLEDPCPSVPAASSPSKAPRPRARRPSSTP